MPAGRRWCLRSIDLSVMKIHPEAVAVIPSPFRSSPEDSIPDGGWESTRQGSRIPSCGFRSGSWGARPALDQGPEAEQAHDLPVWGVLQKAGRRPVAVQAADRRLPGEDLRKVDSSMS